jgi:serine/threonine-protein kinase
MVVELRMAERRLHDESYDEGDAAGSDGGRSSVANVVDTGRSVMVVESDANMQNVFREGFKRAGYRVLVIADPVRAVSRFRQDPTVADCAIFNAQAIGSSALEMFNELGEDKRTQAIPAMLLLDEDQQTWKSQAAMAQHRIVLSMPITMKQLRTILSQLAPSRAKVTSSANVD